MRKRKPVRSNAVSAPISNATLKTLQQSQQRVQQLTSEFNKFIGRWFFTLVLAPWLYKVMTLQFKFAADDASIAQVVLHRLKRTKELFQSQFNGANAQLLHALLHSNCIIILDGMPNSIPTALPLFADSLKTACNVPRVLKHVKEQIIGPLIQGSQFYWHKRKEYLAEVWKGALLDEKTQFLNALYNHKASIHQALSATCPAAMGHWIKTTRHQFNNGNYAAVLTPLTTPTTIRDASLLFNRTYLDLQNDIQYFERNMMTDLHQNNRYFWLVFNYFKKISILYVTNEILLSIWMKLEKRYHARLFQFTPYHLLTRHLWRFISSNPVPQLNAAPTQEEAALAEIKKLNAYEDDLKSGLDTCAFIIFGASGLILFYMFLTISFDLYEVPSGSLVLYALHGYYQALTYLIAKGEQKFRDHQARKSYAAIKKIFNDHLISPASTPQIYYRENQLNFEFSNYDDLEIFQLCLRKQNIKISTDHKQITFVKSPTQTQLLATIKMYADIIRLDNSFTDLMKQIAKLADAINIDFQSQEDLKTNELPIYSCELYLPAELYMELLYGLHLTFVDNKIESDQHTKRVSMVGSTAADPKAFKHLLQAIQTLQTARKGDLLEEKQEDLYAQTQQVNFSGSTKRTRRKKPLSTPREAEHIPHSPALAVVYYTWSCALGNFFYQTGNPNNTAFPLHSSHHVGRIHSMASLNQTRSFVGFAFRNVEEPLRSQLIALMLVARVVPSRGFTGHVKQKGTLENIEYDIKFKFAGADGWGDTRALGSRFKANNGEASIFIYHDLILDAHP